MTQATIVTEWPKSTVSSRLPQSSHSGPARLNQAPRPLKTQLLPVLLQISPLQALLQPSLR